MLNNHTYQQDIFSTVQAALAEDIGDGDITAQLVAAKTQASAKVISRDEAIICGQEWVNEVFRQIDAHVEITWHVKDGDKVSADQTLFELKGKARSLLTGERAALNFLQTLSATATSVHSYALLVEHTKVRILDTRKTIPCLRTAQKYAISCGGGYNHRIGLYDAFLIKENHIAACGGIAQAVQQAKQIAPNKPIEVEVESLDELEQALSHHVDTIMLDNFSLEDTCIAVTRAAGISKLEASGGVDKNTLVKIAETGVDYISIGALTKHVQAIDLSMRFI